ncbi:MAG: ABC transporter permease [Treponema sp.]|nr:ABC transporter permease [Treponema sp.]
MINFLAFSCPLLLAATGALFSEYAGCLALFMDGLITFCGFLTYAFTVATGSAIAGTILCAVISVALCLLFAFILEKTHADFFIGAIALNLLFGALTSLFSWLCFGTRGVLTNQAFVFKPSPVNAAVIIITLIFITGAILFLKKTNRGIYFRITGSDADVLLVRGVSPALYRILSWGVSGFFAGFAGSFLALRICSFVPNLASGKGWLALAAVFMGKRRLPLIAIFALIFCAVDFGSVYIQSFIPGIPSSVILSLPYIVSLALVFLYRI